MDMDTGRQSCLHSSSIQCACTAPVAPPRCCRMARNVGAPQGQCGIAMAAMYPLKWLRNPQYSCPAGQYLRCISLQHDECQSAGPQHVNSERARQHIRRCWAPAVCDYACMPVFGVKAHVRAWGFTDMQLLSVAWHSLSDVCVAKEAAVPQLCAEGFAIPRDPRHQDMLLSARQQSRLRCAPPSALVSAAGWTAVRSLQVAEQPPMAVY